MYDILYVISFAPLLLFVIVFLYFTIVHKNAFEKKLALFQPYRELPQSREAYMKVVHKYRKYANITLTLMFYLPLCIFMLVMLKENYEEIGRLYMAIPDDVKMLILLALVPVVAVHYLISYVLKRNEKAYHMLLEQMSDTDFEFLLKIKDSLPFISKYNPPFVWCNNQLYIFLFYAIREIDPTKIIAMNWSNGKNGIFVRLKASENTIITLPRNSFPYFLQIIEKYAKI